MADSPRGLGIARVALTLQLTIAPEKLEALLREADRQLAVALAARVDAWVRDRKLGYYPALEFLVAQGVCLWPVFSSVQIERAQSMAFLLPRVTPGKPDAARLLAQHYFPNAVRLELALATLDKLNRLEDVIAFSEQKVVRNLRDAFEAVSVSAARRIDN